MGNTLALNALSCLSGQKLPLSNPDQCCALQFVVEKSVSETKDATETLPMLCGLFGQCDCAHCDSRRNKSLHMS